MGIVVGAPAKFTTADEFNIDGDPLLEAAVDHVTIEIFPDRSTTPVLAPTPMSFDVDTGHWAFIWDSSGQTAGIYEARIELTTTDGLVTPKCERFQLEAC